MKRIGKDECYSCFYCDADNVPLIQIGEECCMQDFYVSGDKVVSPEDANAVELCERCLIKSLAKLLKKD